MTYARLRTNCVAYDVRFDFLWHSQDGLRCTVSTARPALVGKREGEVPCLTDKLMELDAALLRIGFIRSPLH